MGFDIPSKTATIFNDGEARWSTTTLSTIGLAVKNALLLPEKTSNKYLFINSFTVSSNHVFRSLEKSTGTKWKVTKVDAEQQKRAGMEKMASADFSGGMTLIRYLNQVEGHGADFTTYEEGSNGLLSLPKENLDDVIAGIVRGQAS